MNRALKISKNHIICFLFVLIAATLAGCGSSGYIPEGYWKLVEITEDDKTVKDAELTDYGLDDAYISMAYDGDPSSGCAVIFGVPRTFTCFKDEGYLAFPSTGKVNYAYKGKKLALADKNVTMIFEKSKDKAPAIPEEPDYISFEINGGSKEVKADAGSAAGSIDSGSGSETGSDSAEAFIGGRSQESGEDEGGDDTATGSFFEGNWYGWMTIDGRTDFWKQINGEVYDAMCEVKMKDAEHATVTIWDAGMPYESPIARVDVTVSDKGSDPKKGVMISETNGFFLDGNFNNNSWYIDPGQFEWSDYMMIASTYVDGDGVDAMDYVFHFKKWGDDWSDFSQKPPHFNWYKKLIDAGEPMPDTIPED